MRFARIVAVAATFSLLSTSLMAQVVALPRSTPEAQGVSSVKVREFLEAADQDVKSMHSFMLAGTAMSWPRPGGSPNRPRSSMCSGR